MNKDARANSLHQRKVAAIEQSEKWGKASRTSHTFRSGFYRWKTRYVALGGDGLKLRKLMVMNQPSRTPEDNIVA